MRHGDSQITLLTFAARLLANPAFATPFADWSTWGFDEQTAHAQLTAAQWASHLTPIVNAAKLRAPLNYWEGRMPGTGISRQSHAENLLRQHLISSLDIAYGQGTLSLESWLQGRQPSPRYAQLQWRLPTNRYLTSTVALLIAPVSGQTHWLIYLPGIPDSVQQFANLESLRDWVYQNRFRFWADPRSPVTQGNRDDVVFTDTQGDGISLFMEETLRQHQEITDHYLLEACRQSETSPLDWTALRAWENQRSAMVAQYLHPEVEAAIEEVIAKDTALPDEEVHFACLEQHLPAGWRQQCVERQENLLEHYLGDTLELTSEKVSLLRERQASLDQLQDAHDAYLLALPEPVSRANLQAQVAEETHEEHIADGLCQALLEEARLQNTLGELSATHLGWVESLIDRPEPSLQRPVLASTLELVCADRKWPLRGYMTLRAIPTDDEEVQDQTVLLYRPGMRGGLMAFADEPALARRLLATLHGAWPDALLESAQPAVASDILDALSGSTSVTITQTPILSHFMRHCVASIVAALPGVSSREQARQQLCISENKARAVALGRFAEKNRSSYFSEQLGTLRHLDANQLAALSTQTKTLKNALRDSAELLQLSLPARMQFAQLKLNAHLCRAFGLQTVPHITLDIADSVTLKREVTGQSGMLGAGSREVPVFSESRSEVSLASFMLWALDDERRHRLNNANIRFEPAADTSLQSALTPAYLADLIQQLDIAGDYERRITQTYLGFEHESEWQVQWRQETLRTPYAIRLQMLVTSRPTSLETDGQRLLETFCHEQLDDVNARTITYRSVTLKPGTAADGSNDSVGLAGIYLIEGPGDLTLLYIPDAPNGTIVRQYTSSTAACQALQDMALDSEMARYLANQSLSGDPEQHESYISTALQRNFQSFLVPGPSRSESLPTHECRLDMGMHIRSHRATSRSQADLTLSEPEIATRHLLLGLRLAFGIVPGVGTLMAVYDGWHAANATVRAFERGNLEEGLQYLVSLLQSFTDAMLSLAPLAATTPANPAAAARLRTLQRQRLDPLRAVPAIRKTRPSPFAGYETELPPGPMLPSTLPQGAGVFEHGVTRQRYIARHGTWYSVEWDPSYLTWRLKPQGIRSYRQPVRLSEQGSWETPGRLNGLLVNDGLQGGGGALTTLYNQGVAYWRQAIRRQPPQLTGMSLAHDINGELIRIRTRMSTRQAEYRSAMHAIAEGAQPSDSQRAAIADARNKLSAELNRNIDYNARSITRLREQRATLSRADYSRFTALCEANINEMTVLDMHLAADRLLLAKAQVDLAVAAIQALPGPSAPTTVVKRLAQASLRANQEMIETLQVIERLAIRHQTRRNQLQGRALTDYLMRVEETGLTLDVDNARLVQATILSTSLFNENAVEHPQIAAFMDHFHEQGIALRSTLSSQLQLPRAGLSRAQERAFLESAQNRYARYLNHLKAWEDNFVELLSPDDTGAFRQLMRKLMDDIDAQLSRAKVGQQRPDRRPNRGASRPRLFDTVDGPLIGEAVSQGGQTHMRIDQPNSDRLHTAYTMTEAGQWQLSTAQRSAPTQPLSILVGAARSRLDDLARLQARLRRYQTTDALPLDLEDIAQSHAQQLRFIADRLRQKAGASITPEQSAISQRLKAAAEQMQDLGRELRVAQTKATRKPTVAYLEYLVEQQEVEVAWSRTLKPKLDRKGNPVEYLEEYRINDRNTGQPLWYAHFHFRQKPVQGFTRLEAGHLKLASERDLGAGAWRGSMNETQASRLFGQLRPAS
ncbi:hypothetical protein QSV36_11225 [Pseudomonas sp. BCRC 81390]|nr:hypothetical protein [Pseudomonas sp. BCRC 81390]